MLKSVYFKTTVNHSVICRAFYALIVLQMPLAAQAGWRDSLRSTVNQCRIIFHSIAPAPEHDFSKSWENLPDAYRDPVDPAFLDGLKFHPTFQALRSRYALGEKLAFTFEDEFHTVTQLNGAAGIQANFASQVLTAVFPKAIVGLRDESRITTHMRLWDSGLPDPPKELDIAVLKSSNPGPAMPPQRELRQRMGLPESAQMASMYVAADSAPGARDVLKSLFRENLASMILLSWRSPPRSGVLASLHSAMNEQGVKVIQSSDVPRSRFIPGRRYLVINETRGRMPYVHAAADFSIVLGSANIFEAGLRPIYFQHSPAHGYDFNVWNAGTRRMLATGAGHVITSFMDLPALIRATSGTQGVLREFEVVDEHGLTSIDRLAASIAVAIETAAARSAAHDESANQ